MILKATMSPTAAMLLLGHRSPKKSTSDQREPSPSPLSSLSSLGTSAFQAVARVVDKFSLKNTRTLASANTAAHEADPSIDKIAWTSA